MKPNAFPRIRRASTLALVAAFALGGCAAAPQHYFTLSSTVTGAGPATSGLRVLVGPVSVPEAVDRPQFVLRVTPNRVEVDDLDRWATPLGEGIAAVVVGDLQALLATPDVAVAPVPSFDPTHRVTIDVQRFESVPGRSVSLDALWSVTPMEAPDAVRIGRTTVEEPVAAEGLEAVAQAHSRAIAQMSRGVADALRAATKETGKAPSKGAAKAAAKEPAKTAR